MKDSSIRCWDGSGLEAPPGKGSVMRHPGEARGEVEELLRRCSSVSGFCAAGAEALMKAGRTEMVTALCRSMKRLHVRCSAIKTADLAHEGAR